MRNTTRREGGRRKRGRGDAKPSRLPLGGGAPAPEGSGRIRTPRLLRSVRNKYFHPSIISRLDGGFILYTVDTAAREERRKARDSGRLESPHCPHRRMSLTRNTPAITKESKSASAARRDIARSSKWTPST